MANVQHLNPGSDTVAVLYLMDADGQNIRQLCFDQDHDWCPTVLNDGRVLYLRWEYTDIPHAFSRILFHMNPDGTEQMEYYGSNSYWPNSTFYARPIPGHPTQVIAVISGHHGAPRMGELVLFDPAQGRFEGGGVLQRIPGHRQPVEPIIRDGLTVNSWPKFLHPYPLSDKYFLVACKPMPQSRWGIYLVDVFDNFLLIKDSPGYALMEPIPFRKAPLPPIIPEKVNLSRTDAVVYIPDIYVDDGLKGVPRGTVKSLRLVGYHFAYHGMGGLVGVVGMDGPWDVKRVLGTVPVNPDGSAKFLVPANTPISIQPLDEEGNPPRTKEILIVDDHPATRECLTELFRLHGHQTAACGSVEAAQVMLPYVEAVVCDGLDGACFDVVASAEALGKPIVIHTVSQKEAAFWRKTQRPAIAAGRAHGWIWSSGYSLK